MGLETSQPVGDVDALPLQLLRPGDVVLLVEAGFQLQQDRDLGIVVPGFDQGWHERRVLPDPVEGLLNRNHVWIR